MKKNIIVWIIYAVWMSIIAVMYGLFLKGLKMKQNEVLANMRVKTVEEAFAKFQREQKTKNQ